MASRYPKEFKYGLMKADARGLHEAACTFHHPLAGGQVNSTAVTLRPGPLRSGTFVADTQTAGSCTLMLQAALPCLLFAAPQPDGCVHMRTKPLSLRAIKARRMHGLGDAPHSS